MKRVHEIDLTEQPFVKRLKPLNSFSESESPSCPTQEDPGASTESIETQPYIPLLLTNEQKPAESTQPCAKNSTKKPAPESTIIRHPTFCLRPKATPPIARLSGYGLWGKKIEFTFHLPFCGFCIGRKHPRTDLDLMDFPNTRTVSHLHCRIIYDPLCSRFKLENFGRNGTRVNHQLFRDRNSGIKLSHGDTIDVGKLQLLFEELPRLNF